MPFNSIITNKPDIPVTQLSGTPDAMIAISHTGVGVEVTLGTSGTVLTSNGATAAPTFQAPSGGGVSTVNTRSGAVVLGATDIPAFVASGGSHAPGAVPDPGSSAGSTKFLREDATWAVPAGAGGVTTVNTRSGAVVLVATDIPVFIASGGSHAPGAVPDPGSSSGVAKFLREDATWAVPAGAGGVTTVNTRSGAVVLVATDIPVFIASGGSHAPGAVPDPGSSAGSTKFLREDATWAIPAGAVFGGSGVRHSIGLVPDPGSVAGVARFLREDASFAIPPLFVGDVGVTGLVTPVSGWTSDVNTNDGGSPTHYFNTTTNAIPTPSQIAVSTETGGAGYGALSVMLNNGGVFNPAANTGILGLQANTGSMAGSNIMSIRLDLGFIASLASYTLGIGFSGTANFGYGWVFQGTNDNTFATWATLDTQTGQNLGGPSSLANAPGTVYPVSSVPYRWYQVRMTAADPAPGTAVQAKFSQFQLTIAAPAPGYVPAPAFGSVIFGKVLHADGTWAAAVGTAFVGDSGPSGTLGPASGWSTAVATNDGGSPIHYFNTSSNTTITPSMVAVSTETAFSGYGSLDAMLNNGGLYNPGANTGLIGLNANTGSMTGSNVMSLRYDIGSPAPIDSYTIAIGFGGTAGFGYGWVVEGSNDPTFVAWVAIDTQTGQNIATSTANAPGITYTVTSAAYRWYQLRFTAADPAPSVAVQTKLCLFNIHSTSSPSTVGDVPAPAVGDAIAGKVLTASGLWGLPTGLINPVAGDRGAGYAGAFPTAGWAATTHSSTEGSSIPSTASVLEVHSVNTSTTPHISATATAISDGTWNPDTLGPTGSGWAQMLNNNGVYDPTAGGTAMLAFINTTVSFVSPTQAITMRYDMAAPVNIVSYTLGLSFGGTANFAYAWVFEGTNDPFFTTWVAIDTQTGQNLGGSGYVSNVPGTTYPVTSAVSYRWYRIRFTSMDNASLSGYGVSNPTHPLHVLVNHFSLVTSLVPSVSGAAPAPALGDALAGKFLNAYGTWGVPTRSVVAQYAAAILAETSLIGYWRLDDPDNTSFYSVPLYSESVAGNKLGVFGTVHNRVKGPFHGNDSYAVWLDGTNSSYLYGGEGFVPPAGASPFSVEFWVKSEEVATEQIIFSYTTVGGSGNHGWYVELYTSNTIRLNGGAGFTADNVYGALHFGWHHIVVVYDGSTTITHFVDGVPCGTPQTITAFNTVGSLSTMHIGDGNSSTNLRGSVAHVAVYNVALTGAQILAHYLAAF
jgi:hypothetical protein